MMKTHDKSIPAQSSPELPRAAFSVKAAGHSSTNGLQKPGSDVEQSGQRTADLLDGQPQRKKISASGNKERIKCFYTIKPSKRGFQQ